MNLEKLPMGRIATGLAAGALVLGVIGMFVPVATFSTSFFGATAEADGFVWRASFHAEGFGESSSESKSWYDDDFDDEDGNGLVRAAAPLIAIACALALAAAVAFVRMPAIAALLAAVAAATVAIGVWLLAEGLKDLFDDQQEWSWGFWLLICAAVLAAAAAVLGFLDGRSRVAPDPGPSA